MSNVPSLILDLFVNVTYAILGLVLKLALILAMVPIESDHFSLHVVWELLYTLWQYYEGHVSRVSPDFFMVLLPATLPTSMSDLLECQKHPDSNVAGVHAGQFQGLRSE